MTTRQSNSIILLFLSVALTAAGYGATFLLTEHFRALGGNEINTGWTLGGAAVGTLIGVPAVGWLAPRLGAVSLAAAGSLAVALGFGLLSGLGGISSLTVVSGFLIGLGWGAFYLAGPMSLSDRVTDENRIFWFMWLGAVQMIGIGCGPVLLDYLRLSHGFGTSSIFRLVAVGAVAAACLAILFGMLFPRPASSAKPTTGWVRAIVPLSRTSSIYPIIMVFLGACVFTSILTFQSSIAKQAGFDPSWFYLAYTATVVVARFTLAPIASRSNPDVAAIVLLIVMSLGVGLALIQGTQLVLFLLAAVFLGIGYGLVYSVIQTQVVNNSPPEYRNAALTWFVLAYFIGVFGYPVIGGWMIVWLGTQFLLGTLLVLALLELALAVVARRVRSASPAIAGKAA